jgi:endoglucanase
MPRRSAFKFLVGVGVSVVALVSSLISAVGSSAKAASPAPVSNGPTFQVGRSINASAGWNRVHFTGPNDTGPLADPPYWRNQTWTDEEKPEDFAYMKQLGFNSVRFMVEPTPFVQLSGARLEALYAELKTTISQITNTGLNVIVDLHTIYPDRLGFVDSGEATPGFVAYQAMLTRMATLAAQYDPARVALELQNEPRNFSCAVGTGWNIYQPKLFKTARTAAPQTTIILTGGCGGGIEGLLNVNGSEITDSNTMYSFHYYSSLLFTHQGADWTGVEYFVRDIRYPSTKNGTFDSVWNPTEARINASTVLSPATKARMISEGKNWVAFHMSNGFNRAKIAADIGRVSAWAQTHGIPAERIFMGEFGVIRPKRTDAPGTWRPYGDDRIEWHNDVRVAAEQAGFRWAMFSYMGNFGLLSSRDLLAGTPRIAEPALVSALGLGSVPPPPRPPVTSPPLPTTTTTTTVAPPANRQPLDGKIARLISTCDGTKALDVKGWGKTPGAVVQLYWKNDQPNQRFVFRGVSQDRYQLISQHSGLPIGLNGTAIVQKATSESDDVWKIVGRPNNVAEFYLAANESMALDTTSATLETTPLQIAPVNGTCGQKFTLIWLTP